MSAPRPPIVAAAALAAALLSGACSGPAPQQPDPLSPAPLTTRPGAQMTLQRLGGGEVSLQGLRGKPVLITLFTTWCLRCQAEAPLFNQIQALFLKIGLAKVSAQ